MADRMRTKRDSCPTQLASFVPSQARISIETAATVADIRCGQEYCGGEVIGRQHRKGMDIEIAIAIVKRNDDPPVQLPTILNALAQLPQP